VENGFVTYLSSPLGMIEIRSSGDFITSVHFVMDEGESSETIPEVLKTCRQQLQEYFAGKRKDFDVPLEPEGTGFQKQVWNELKKIKFGDTITYNTIAKELNNPGSIRAVGAANGSNPVAIILPCHRVIGSNGKLTGYAGGLWRKQWLLEHEGNVSGKNRTLF
jgi:methylated-DNA-[protein]-cysteine S-methyltransferase